MTFLAGQLAEPPLIAILRGIQPEEVLAIGKALYDAGFRIIEIPLNSPQPLQSIQNLAEVFLRDILRIIKCLKYMTGLQ